MGLVTSGRRKLGSLIYFSYLWDLEQEKGREGCFKVIIWGLNAAHNGGVLIGGFSLCDTAVLKLYNKPYWVL